MRPLNGWTLITGAGSGIGSALAREFAAHGHKLILSGREFAALERAAQGLVARFGIEARVFVADLAAPGAGARLAEAVAGAGLEVGCLVNNAGVGLSAQFVAALPDALREVMTVNMVSLVELTRPLAASMAARGAGRILNVASTAAFQPGPWQAVYYASKSFVLSFSLALREELGNKGVTVTALCPGPTRSGFNARAGIRETPLLRRALMDAEPVARLGYRALLRGDAVAIPGMMNRLAALAARFFPPAWSAAAVGRMQRPA